MDSSINWTSIAKIPPDITFKFSDLSGEDGGISAHKFVLAMASDVFMNMFYTNNTVDKSASEVTIEDTTKPVFRVMIDDIYGIRSIQESLAHKSLHEVFSVLRLVKKYNLSNLMLAAKERVSAFQITEDSVLEIAHEAFEFSTSCKDESQNLVRECVNFLKTELNLESFLRVVADNVDKMATVHKLAVLFSEKSVVHLTQIEKSEERNVKNCSSAKELLQMRSERNNVEKRISINDSLNSSKTVENETESNESKNLDGFGEKKVLKVEMTNNSNIIESSSLFNSSQNIENLEKCTEKKKTNRNEFPSVSCEDCGTMFVYLSSYIRHSRSKSACAKALKKNTSSKQSNSGGRNQIEKDKDEGVEKCNEMKSSESACDNALKKNSTSCAIGNGKRSISDGRNQTQEDKDESLEQCSENQAEKSSITNVNLAGNIKLKDGYTVNSTRRLVTIVNKDKFTIIKNRKRKLANCETKNSQQDDSKKIKMMGIADKVQDERQRKRPKSERSHEEKSEDYVKSKKERKKSKKDDKKKADRSFEYANNFDEAKHKLSVLSENKEKGQSGEETRSSKTSNENVFTKSDEKLECEEPNLNKIELQVGDFAYALLPSKQKEFRKCQITEQVDNSTYRIQFETKNTKTKKGSKKDGNKLAFFEPPKDTLPVGTKCIAVYQNDQKFYPAVVAESPTVENDYRYLIFFDDGHVAYLSCNDLRAVVGQNKTVVVVDQNEEPVFIPVPRYAVGDQVEKFLAKAGEWVEASVVEVDASMVKIDYGVEYEPEWVYGGRLRRKEDDPDAN